jgi:hypothetical protein
MKNSLLNDRAQGFCNGNVAGDPKFVGGLWARFVFWEGNMEQNKFALKIIYDAVELAR